MIVLLTGQPGSGKTTLAKALMDAGVVDYVIDGDQLRLIREEGYDERGRHANIERAYDIALYLHGEGKKVAVALIQPYRPQREQIKSEVDATEVYLHTSETRGREHFWVEHYQPPESPSLILDTGEWSVEECVEEIRGAVNG